MKTFTLQNTKVPNYITKSANYTAVSGDNIIITATLTITLPSSPSAGNTVSLLSGTDNVIKVTISSPDKIMSATSPRIVQLCNVSGYVTMVNLYYLNSSIGWICRENYSLNCFILSSIISSLNNYGGIGLQSSDGTAWGWGANASGQLGNNTITASSVPVSVVGGIVFSQLTFGYNHTLGIRTSDGTAWAWGANASGQLGTNNVTPRSSPISVVGANSWKQLSVQYVFSMGVKGSDGTGWGWGLNSSGCLGNNTSGVSYSSPISVVGANSWKMILAGGLTAAGFCLAIRGSDGTGWAWGINNMGMLGQNTVTARSSPVSIVGGNSWKQLSAGQYHSLGIRGSDGTGWAWGDNSAGEIGDNTVTNSRSSPVSIVGGISWSQLSAGYDYSLGIRGSDGSAWGWGTNIFGGLGVGDQTVRISPVSIFGGLSFSQISAGQYTSLGLMGSVLTSWGWGYDGGGEFGNNQTGNSYSSPIIITQ